MYMSVRGDADLLLLTSQSPNSKVANRDIWMIDKETRKGTQPNVHDRT